MEEMKVIVLESGLDYFTNSEYTELQELFTEQGMKLIATRQSGPKASFGDVIIYINQHITELFISGFLMTAAYDVLKFGVSAAVRKIKEKGKILQGDKLRPAVPCIKYRLHNMEICAPIPSNLTNEQFDKYFDSINELIKEVDNCPTVKKETLIIESNGSKLVVKTIYEYAQEQSRSKTK